MKTYSESYSEGLTSCNAKLADLSNSAKIVFCRVERSNGISGGDIYDQWLVDSTRRNSQAEVEEFTLFEHLTLPLEGIMGKLSQLFIPLLALMRMLNYRRRISASHIAWEFNTSKAFYFLLPAIVVRLLGDDCIGLTHHMLYLQFSGVRRLLYRLIELCFISLMSRPVAPSEFTRDCINHHLPWADVALLPIPFDKSSPAATTDYSSQNLSSDMVFIGTIEPRKGLHYLLQSMTMLKHRGEDLHLRVIGKMIDRNYCAMLHTIVKRENLNVTFEGFVDVDLKREMLNQTKMFVFPSTAEGYGMVLVEAMQSSLPIVAFNNTSIPYILGKNERGLVSENLNAASMAENISRLYENPALRSEIGARGLQFASCRPGRSDFDLRWEQILSEILATRRAASQHTVRVEKTTIKYGEIAPVAA